MKVLKKRITKLICNVKNYYALKETWKDGIFIGGILLIMTFFPGLYDRIPVLKWRLLLAVFSFAINFVLLLFVIRRLLRRHLVQKPKKADWLHFLMRMLILLTALTIAVVLQVKILYPAFFGIADIRLSGENQYFIWIVQSIFFSFYSQAFVSVCIRIKQPVKEWFISFLQSCLKCVLPLTLATLLITAGIYALSNISQILAHALSVPFTTFLWITAMVMQERGKIANEK